MVQLTHSDIHTTEVLQWQGIHLLHFTGSSCSQKTRIYLNLKQLDWTSHEISLARNENFSDWYLGINPRGLVPALVLNGDVHIESNDILLALETAFPKPVLVPPNQHDDINELLGHEDDLHLDLRTLTFRYTHKREKAPKSNEALANYRTGGSGKVQGAKDTQRDIELNFWETIATDGITDDAVKVSAAKFRQAFEVLEDKLASTRYLHGDNLSVLDIAWYVYANRLMVCGYPLARLHPRLASWFAGLDAQASFHDEVQPAPAIAESIAQNHREQRAAGRSLEQVTGY